MNTLKFVKMHGAGNANLGDGTIEELFNMIFQPLPLIETLHTTIFRVTLIRSI